MDRKGSTVSVTFHKLTPYKKEGVQDPFWGARIPVISVTVWTVRRERTAEVYGQQEGSGMRCNFVREKKILCGDTYMAVGIYAITPAEHTARRKKSRESTEGQKAKNKMASLRRRQRVALANFDKRGFFLTGTYENAYLPEDMEECLRDVRNYRRRVIAATCRRFGVEKRHIRLMLVAVRKGETGRLHMHGFAQCVGMGEAERREWREMLEDLWRRRIPGTGEYDPLGTMNVDRMDTRKLLGKDGGNGTLGYLYGHKERAWVETSTLKRPVEQMPSDTKWSRKQLRTACGEMAQDAYWWSQRFPGWELQKCVVLEPGALHQSPGEERPKGWEQMEPQCYVILRRVGAAKVRT